MGDYYLKCSELMSSPLPLTDRYLRTLIAPPFSLWFDSANMRMYLHSEQAPKDAGLLGIVWHQVGEKIDEAN